MLTPPAPVNRVRYGQTLGWTESDSSEVVV